MLGQCRHVGTWFGATTGVAEELFAFPALVRARRTRGRDLFRSIQRVGQGLLEQLVIRVVRQRVPLTEGYSSGACPGRSPQQLKR